MADGSLWGRTETFTRVLMWQNHDRSWCEHPDTRNCPLSPLASCWCEGACSSLPCWSPHSAHLSSLCLGRGCFSSTSSPPGRPSQCYQRSQHYNNFVRNLDIGDTWLYSHECTVSTAGGSLIVVCLWKSWPSDVLSPRSFSLVESFRGIIVLNAVL